GIRPDPWAAIESGPRLRPRRLLAMVHFLAFVSLACCPYVSSGGIVRRPRAADNSRSRRQLAPPPPVNDCHRLLMAVTSPAPMNPERADTVTVTPPKNPRPSGCR